MYDYFSNKGPFLCDDICMWGYTAETKPNIRWESFAAKGRHTPDAIWQRGAIFHFSKRNKSVYNRKLWQI